MADIVAAGGVAPRDAPAALPWLGVGSGRRKPVRAVQRAPGCALRLRLGIPGGVALRCGLKAPAWARQSRLGCAGRTSCVGGSRLALHPSACARLAGGPYAGLAADGRCAAPAARWRLCFALAGSLLACSGAVERLQRAARRAGAAGAAGGCCADEQRVRGHKAGCSSGGRAVAGGGDSTALRLSGNLVTRLALLLTRTTFSQTRACAGHTARALALAHASRRRRLAKARVRRELLQHASAGPDVARDALRPPGWELLGMGNCGAVQTGTRLPGRLTRRTATLLAVWPRRGAAWAASTPHVSAYGVAARRGFCGCRSVRKRTALRDALLRHAQGRHGCADAVARERTVCTSGRKCVGSSAEA